MGALAAVAIIVVACVTVVVLGCVAVVEHQRRLLAGSARRVREAAHRAQSAPGTAG